MAVSDPIINASYGLPAFSLGRLWIYASLLIGVFIGRRVRNTENVGRVAGALFVNALQFFLISNFASWLQSGMYVTVPTPYPHTLGGLFQCYVAALPFFGWTLLGDMTYGAVFFGLHAWLSRSVAVRERVAA
jgi:hypothetical protein